MCRNFRRNRADAAAALITYTLLFFLCLGCVLHLICWQAVLLSSLPLYCFLLTAGFCAELDYGLLATFVFSLSSIGDMGRLPVIVDLLRTVLSGHASFLWPFLPARASAMYRPPSAFRFYRKLSAPSCRRKHRRAGHYLIAPLASLISL